MRVSVILPNYNHSKYLKQRIDSILNQTFQDFELILLDDNSPDDSVDIIESYRGHKRVSHIHLNKENSGSTFKQWERGFSLAKGEYIWIAESDDYSDERFLEMCVKGLDENPTASLCFSDSYFVDSDGIKVIDSKGLEELILGSKSRGLHETPQNLNVESDKMSMLYDGFEFFHNRLLHANYIYNASMVLFRKNILSEMPSSYTAFRGCGDWLFWGEMMIRYDVARVPKRLNYFRQHDNKVSSKNAIGYNNMIESANVKYYLLSLFSSEAKQHRLRKRDIRRVQGIVIKEIMQLATDFAYYQPSRSTESRSLQRNLKYHFWEVCYLQHYKKQVKRLFKRRRSS